MPSSPETTYLVSAQQDPVVLRIQGKANYLNCACVSEFFEHMIADGHREFVVDFRECRGMDSTFLGILASAGLQLREQDPPGKLVLVRLNRRNLELVRNLGLHHIMTIDEGGTLPGKAVEPEASLTLPGSNAAKAANSELVLKAHQALSNLDESNKKKFQDVLSFLKNQMDDIR